MLEKGTESIVDGQIIENIKPEWTLESRVPKLLWARGESRRDGR